MAKSDRRKGDVAAAPSVSCGMDTETRLFSVIESPGFGTDRGWVIGPVTWVDSMFYSAFKRSLLSSLEFRELTQLAQSDRGKRAITRRVLSLAARHEHAVHAVEVPITMYLWAIAYRGVVGEAIALNLTNRFTDLQLIRWFWAEVLVFGPLGLIRKSDADRLLDSDEDAHDVQEDILPAAIHRQAVVEARASQLIERWTRQ